MISIDSFVKVLNEAYVADPAAIHALIANRVPCNRALANHPTIQVAANQVIDGESYTVSLIGIINGIAEEVTGERVAVMWSEENTPSKMLGFVPYRKL